MKDLIDRYLNQIKEGDERTILGHVNSEHN